jgi:hypothetical protein
MSRSALLGRLLAALVDEWGYDAVNHALAGLRARRDVLQRDSPEFRRSRNAKKAKPLAVEQVARAQLADPQRRILSDLAVRFDARRIFPSVADVREFLVVMGERPGGLKDRSDAFRELLHSLSKLPVDRLQHLVANARSAGPSRLGPLSEAISSLGDSLLREPNSDDK